MSPQIEIFPFEGETDDGVWIVIRITGLEIVDFDSSVTMIRNCEASMKSILNSEVETEIHKIGESIISRAVLKSFIEICDIEKINALLRALYADINRNLFEVPYQGVTLKLWGWKERMVPSLNGYTKTYIISILDEYRLRGRPVSFPREFDI